MVSLKSYGEWALVTGASAGIGTVFARKLAAQGVNVALVARRADRLEALATELREQYKVKTRVIPEDLERDGVAERLIEWVRDLEIGILVNNARMAGTRSGGPWSTLTEIGQAARQRDGVTIEPFWIYRVSGADDAKAAVALPRP